MEYIGTDVTRAMAYIGTEVTRVMAHIGTEVTLVMAILTSSVPASCLTKRGKNLEKMERGLSC